MFIPQQHNSCKLAQEAELRFRFSGEFILFIAMEDCDPESRKFAF